MTSSIITRRIPKYIENTSDAISDIHFTTTRRTNENRNLLGLLGIGAFCIFTFLLTKIASDMTADISVATNNDAPIICPFLLYSSLTLNCSTIKNCKTVKENPMIVSTIKHMSPTIRHRFSVLDNATDLNDMNIISESSKSGIAYLGRVRDGCGGG